VHRRTIGQTENQLDRSLAVRSLSDQDAAPLVPDGAGHQFGGASRATVYQHNQCFVKTLSTWRCHRFGLAITTLLVEHHAAIQELGRDLHGFLQQAAGIGAQVEDPGCDAL